MARAHWLVPTTPMNRTLRGSKSRPTQAASCSAGTAPRHGTHRWPHRGGFSTGPAHGCVCVCARARARVHLCCVCVCVCKMVQRIVRRCNMLMSNVRAMRVCAHVHAYMWVVGPVGMGVLAGSKLRLCVANLPLIVVASDAPCEFDHLSGVSCEPKASHAPPGRSSEGYNDPASTSNCVCVRAHARVPCV